MGDSRWDIGTIIGMDIGTTIGMIITNRLRSTSVMRSVLVVAEGFI